MNRNEIKAILNRTAKRRGVEIDGLLLRDYVEDIAEMLATERSNADEAHEEDADNEADEIIAALDEFVYNTELNEQQSAQTRRMLDGIAGALHNLPCYRTDDKINLLKLKLY